MELDIVRTMKGQLETKVTEMAAQLQAARDELSSEASDRMLAAAEANLEAEQAHNTILENRLEECQRELARKQAALTDSRLQLQDWENGEEGNQEVVAVPQLELALENKILELKSRLEEVNE